jgi:hypothetical protein
VRSVNLLSHSFDTSRPSITEGILSAMGMFQQLRRFALLLVVVCFSRRLLGRFPAALQKCAGSASIFEFHPFISLSSSGVI